MIIKSKTYSVNFHSCMQNAEGLYLAEDVLHSIAIQAPELVNLLPVSSCKWLTKETVKGLVSSYDKKQEEQARIRTSSIMNKVRIESQKVFASFDPFFNDYIELGYSDSSALFKEIAFEELVRILKKRGEGFDTNIAEKEMAHDAIYRLSLKKQSTIFIANELGMGLQQ